MDHLKLTTDQLSVEAITDLVTDESCGAISLFVGTTRDNFEGKTVLRLEYEAYEPMALKAMQAICDEVRIKWPTVHSIAIYHRLGMVPAREASVVIAVSSPHRAAALAAVGHTIDQLKSSVPVWKKEVYAGHEPAWKENSECPTNEPTPSTASQQAASKPPTPPAAPSAEKIDKSMIQINVSCEELQQRIQNFIERKRDQLNISNIHDFIPGAAAREGVAEGPEGEGDTCARVRTQFTKRSDSKGHLKIRKVYNEWGPQTMRTRTRRPSDGGALPLGVAERVTTLERSLHVAPVSKDVYQRLKALEDRLAWLHALSPEYKQFWTHNKNLFSEADEGTDYVAEYTYSADDISRRIEQLEREGAV